MAIEPAREKDVIREVSKITNIVADLSTVMTNLRESFGTVLSPGQPEVLGKEKSVEALCPLGEQLRQIFNKLQDHRSELQDLISRCEV